MKYNCTIKKEDNLFVPHFPDMTNVLTYGRTYDEAVKMAKEALNAILESHLENDFPIAEPNFTGGVEIEVEPKVAFAIELRKARAARTQKEIAAAAGMTYQQYQRLENPRKTNPTLETLFRLQKVVGKKFLSI